MVDLGEKQDSIEAIEEIDTLKQFISKSNQSMSSLANMFDYLNDDSVIIKNVKPLESKISKISNIQMEQCEILNDQDDELEIIDLEKVECKMNGFWHNKDVSSFVKFDNFVTSLSDESISSDEEIDLFVNQRSYSPSTCSNQNNLMELEKMSTEEVDLKLASNNFQHPGLFIGHIENFNEKKEFFTTLNLVKCEPQTDTAQMTSDYVEEFFLDPTHDYSRYSASSRYELNKNFNSTNQ